MAAGAEWERAEAAVPAHGGLPASGRGRRRDEASPRCRLVVVRGAGRQTPWRGLSRSRSWSISPGQCGAVPRVGWGGRRRHLPFPRLRAESGRRGLERGGGTGLRSARRGWSWSRLLGATLGGGRLLVRGCPALTAASTAPSRPPPPLARCPKAPAWGEEGARPAWRRSESPPGSGRLPAGQTVPAPAAPSRAGRGLPWQQARAPPPREWELRGPAGLPPPPPQSGLWRREGVRGGAWKRTGEKNLKSRRNSKAAGCVCVCVHRRRPGWYAGWGCGGARGVSWRVLSRHLSFRRRRWGLLTKETRSGARPKGWSKFDVFGVPGILSDVPRGLERKKTKGKKTPNPLR